MYLMWNLDPIKNSSMSSLIFISWYGGYLGGLAGDDSAGLCPI